MHAVKHPSLAACAGTPKFVQSQPHSIKALREPTGQDEDDSVAERLDTRAAVGAWPEGCVGPLWVDGDTDA